MLGHISGVENSFRRHDIDEPTAGAERLLEICARTVSHDKAVDQRIRANQEDKQQIRQHAITTQHSLSSFAVVTQEAKVRAA